MCFIGEHCNPVAQNNIWTKLTILGQEFGPKHKLLSTMYSLPDKRIGMMSVCKYLNTNLLECERNLISSMLDDQWRHIRIILLDNRLIIDLSIFNREIIFYWTGITTYNHGHVKCCKHWSKVSSSKRKPFKWTQMFDMIDWTPE